MPLSPADFYAYSRATGTPVADTAEERAQQAPEVLAFQQNRLQAPKQGPGLLDFLGGAALLAGIGAGTYFGGPTLVRAMRNRGAGQAVAKEAAEITPQAVQNVRNIAARAVADPWGQGNVPQPPSSRYIPSAPWYAETQNVPAVKPSTVDLSRQSATLVEQQAAKQVFHVDQSLNALDTAEDQMTGRVKRELQRNPELDLSQVEALEDVAEVNYQPGMELDAPINTAAAQVTGRVPLDQAESAANFAQTAVQRQRDVISGLATPGSGFSEFSKAANEITASAENFGNSPAVQTRLTSNPGNIWELEELIEESGRKAQAYANARYERGGRTVADLTGEIEVSPALARQLSREGIDVRGGSSVASRMREDTGEAVQLGRGRATFPGKLGEIDNGTVYVTPQRGAGRAVQLSQFSDAPAREGVGVNRFTPSELLERTMASVSYPREIRDQILNPNVPREKIAQYLGTTPKIRGGAVSSNPTMEIAGGARASMPGAAMEEFETAGVGGTGLTYAETADLKQLQQKEKLERAGFTYDPNTGNYSQEIDDDLFDPTEIMTANRDLGTDYGDTEGVGNLLIGTESFKERTNKATTEIPGSVEYAEGDVPDSGRQERFNDVVLPLHRDPYGVQTPGVAVVSNPNADLPFGRQLRSEDVGYRGAMRIESEDMNAEGSRLYGGVESAVATLPDLITTQPVSDWAPNKIYGADRQGNMTVPYKPTSRRWVTGKEPLVGFKRQALMEGDKRTGWITLDNAKPSSISLNRAEMQSVAQDAQDAYFNNPIAKANYLKSLNPDALEAGRAQNIPLSEIGEAYDYQGFIVKALDDHLMDNGIDLPLLKPQISKTSGRAYFPTEANAFAINLLKTEKDTPIYGERILLNAKGQPQVTGFNKGGYPEFATTGTSAPIPGQYLTRGMGGLDPMQAVEGDMDDLAFYNPRIETVSQNRLLGEANRLKGKLQEALEKNPDLDISNFKVTVPTSSTPTGAEMSALRSAMETPQAGVGMRTVPVRDPRTGNIVGKERVSTMNIGSLARTQNPYTGVASPVSGPASRVESGNYQYTPEQLRVHLEPTSQRALSERNKFALTANLTPGGRVVRGALNLGQGLGAIPAGLGTLSESETVSRYGTTGAQLQDFGNRLMSQAAYKRGVQPGPTSNRAINKMRAPGGSDQPMIPGVLETNPLSPRGYTPDSALDFYTKALEQDSAENYVLKKNPPARQAERWLRKDLLDENEVDTWSFADRQPKERMVRRQGRMVPLSKVTQPVQRNVLYPRG